MKALKRIVLTFLFLLLVQLQVGFSQSVKLSNTTVSQKEQPFTDLNGLSRSYDYLEIKTKVTNYSGKEISKIYFSVFFKDKRYGAFDTTAPSKLVQNDIHISIQNGQSKTVSMNIIPPDDINMKYNSLHIEKIVYSDGSFNNR